MKNKYILIFSALLIASCATTNQETRLPVNFTALEFNSLSSQYLSRPTFAKYISYENGNEELIIRVDQYSNSESIHYYDQRYAQEYVNAINKFLEWEILASERGDQITREIATVKGARGTKYKFSLHSGNEAKHFLVIEHCGTVCLENYTHTYNPKGATQLSKLFQSFADGSLRSNQDLDNIYN